MTETTPATAKIITSLIVDLHRESTFRSDFLAAGDFAEAEETIVSWTKADGTQPYRYNSFTDSQLESLLLTAGKLGKLFGIDLSFSNPMLSNGLIRGCPAMGCGCPCPGVGKPIIPLKTFEYRSTVRIVIPGSEALAFAAVLGRMAQLCVDTSADTSVTANLFQALTSVTEITASNPETTIDVGIYLTIDGGAGFSDQKPYLALIVSGLRGIASRSGETGYTAEMDSLLATILSP